MKVEFLDPARAELVEAISFYNSESEGLGMNLHRQPRSWQSRVKYL